jgi:heme a synthase
MPLPGPAARRTIGIAAVVTQAGIGVTGSVVRVTGSGLGCPTWPQCVPGSMVPVEHSEYAALNQWIEFSNRMLIGIVAVVAALCVLAAWRIRQQDTSRRRLVRLAWTMPAGVLAQAVLGGILVRTKLIWWTVAAHFLLSAVLVWLAMLLLDEFTRTRPRGRWLIPSSARVVLLTITGLLATVLVAGTTVTGAGPHGGDPNTPRLQAPIEVLAKVHGGLVVALLAAVLLLGVLLRPARTPARLWRRYAALIVVVLAQGTLGSVQYALGVPEALVSLHVLGAALVVIATATLWCAATDGADEAPDTERLPTGSGERAEVTTPA